MSQNKINLLKEAINEDPEKPFPHFALAKEYQKVNDLDSAQKHYQHLIDHFPAYSGTYYHYVLLLIEIKNMASAQEIIEKGLQILKVESESKLYNELLMLRETYFGH